jgi:hypothetical protein
LQLQDKRKDIMSTPETQAGGPAGAPPTDGDEVKIESVKSRTRVTIDLTDQSTSADKNQKKKEGGSEKQTEKAAKNEDKSPEASDSAGALPQNKEKPGPKAEKLRDYHKLVEKGSALDIMIHKNPRLSLTRMFLQELLIRLGTGVSNKKPIPEFDTPEELIEWVETFKPQK